MRNQTLKLLPLGSKYDNQTLMKKTGVDLAKSKAEIFTNKKYSKKENENDIFLFTKGNVIIGVLKGIKEVKNIGMVVNVFLPSEKVNWKNLKEVADLIIRIPEKELIYQKNKKEEDQPSLSIQKRLEEYKKNKYNWLTMEGLENKLKRCIKGAMEYGLNGGNKEMDIELKKVIWLYMEPMDLLKTLTGYTENIVKYKKSQGLLWGTADYLEDKIKEIKRNMIHIENIMDKYGFIEEIVIFMD